MAVAERGLTPISAISDRMPGGIAMSVVLHVAIALLIVIGLPTLFRPKPLEDMPIAVELVNVAPETRATHPNPYEPRPHAKPEVAPAPPAPKPEPKPEPPKPAFQPPPTAAPPPPAPAPQPPAPKAVTTPPAPPPPQPVAKAAPTPPPPAPLPRPAETQAPPAPPIPKPPPSKPQPPKAMTQPAPKPAQPQDKKVTAAAFDSLLKNLAKDHTEQADDAPPQRQQRSASAAPSSQPRAPLGSQLTTSEIDLVRRQISRCWNVPAGARDAKDLVIELRVTVNPDRVVSQVQIVDTGRYASDDFFRAAADSAVRAVRNPMCSPLHLPPDKYDVWKNITISFNPKDVL